MDGGRPQYFLSEQKDAWDGCPAALPHTQTREDHSLLVHLTSHSPQLPSQAPPPPTPIPLNTNTHRQTTYSRLERGVYLGLTVLLRMAGLPLLSPLRGFLAVCGFARDLAARTAAVAAESAGLAPSSAVRVVLEGYRDRGLPGISPHLDYRR